MNPIFIDELTARVLAENQLKGLSRPREDVQTMREKNQEAIALLGIK